MKFTAILTIPLLLAACARAQHRQPLYGPTPAGVASSDQKEIEDQLASVNQQLVGNDAEIATLDDEIKRIERTRNPRPEMRLRQILDQRAALESRRAELLTRRTSLETLRNSLESRKTVPLQ